MPAAAVPAPTRPAAASTDRASPDRRRWGVGQIPELHIELDIARLGVMYGHFVRQIREARGLNQTDLAEISGIAQSNISAIECDRRVPSTDSLNRLLVACGFELAAVAGDRVVHAPLPRTGWFPDEDLPPPLADDPEDEVPLTSADTPLEDRLRFLDAALELADELKRDR
jgi:transcriptional regulator with XRE-family HTH domain